jgi:hypothetical protein
MATWAEFAGARPELASRGLARFEATGLSLIGTLRRDGSPRISAVEPLIFEGELALGMMWRSMKALDLMRDPRCVVHSTISNKDGTEGEFKVYGRAVSVPVSDRSTRDRYCDALRAAIEWAPEGDEWHLWLMDIAQVSWFRAMGYGEHESEVWREEAG